MNRHVTRLLPVVATLALMAAPGLAQHRTKNSLSLGKAWSGATSVSEPVAANPGQLRKLFF